MSFRTERDSMGEMQIPSEMLYGASTQRAVENFPVSGLRVPRAFIRSMAFLKSSCAEVNKELGKLDAELARAIVEASSQIAQGEYDAHFVVDIFQTGSGTSTNMNYNEVASNIANSKLGAGSESEKKIHPNDHVNMGQSSNDTFPTAMHVSVAVTLTENLVPALKGLQTSLEKKAKEFQPYIKTGRTHLQDATPITLGQEFSAYAAQIKKSIARIERALPSVCELAIGGTAVGTGINTHPEFAKRVCQKLSQKTGLTFVEAENHFEAQAAKDACVEVSGVLNTIAVSLTKIANDIRWLSSGPRCGFYEIKIPETQPGSSIMPGKVNPVIPESVLMVCAQVIGNHQTVTFGGQAGNFELNVMMPVIIYNLLQSIECLAGACRIFDEKCIQGVEALPERLADTIERSLMLATPLAPVIGYDKATKIAKQAFKENKTIRQVAKETLDLSDAELNKALDPQLMIKPGE